jgi:transcriptional regulator with XRE-family HTH domain
MATSGRRTRADLTRRLREEGHTWVEIAAVLRERDRVNMRVALRWAHGWSQSEVAALWCERWPDDPKTFKNISYWERWPESGHPPSLSTLDRLAGLYECDIADLVSDLPGYRQRDGAERANQDAGLVTRIAVDPSAAITAIEQRIRAMSTEEIASTATALARHLDPTTDRRSVLLKLSAALSVAATVPAFADAAVAEDDVPLAADLSGIWHSLYRYPSNGQMLEGQHYVVLHQRGSRLSGKSLPHSSGSQLELDLSLRLPTATGTWTERTSPTGRYMGAVYHGSIQLVVTPTGATMTGKWVGFGSKFTVKTGEWELVCVERSTSQRVLREYFEKV